MKTNVERYFFKLVCVNENNPLEYEILEDVNLPDLNEVHNYIDNHISNYVPEMTKWMLLPMVRM